MRNSLRFYLAVATWVLCVASTPSPACLWDYDTLAVERSRFPSTIELITGKFLRHSQEFYQWRIADRTRRIERDTNDSTLYDDLAVAYDKTNQHEKAIEVTLRKDALHPGLYETHANLGTFYVHAGEFGKGLEHIDRALQINPDAHFGREIVQKQLVEYIMRDTAIGLPLWEPRSDGPEFPSQGIGFAAFVLAAERVSPTSESQRAAVHRRALRGVLGMMRFGNFDSPMLLEVLGDLLTSGEPSEDALQLAARAYLRASYTSEEPTSRQDYRAKAERCFDQWKYASVAFHDSTLGFRRFEEVFQAELSEATDWFESVRADEIAWIEAGLDVDLEFKQEYFDQPELEDHTDPFWHAVEKDSLVKLQNDLAVEPNDGSGFAIAFLVGFACLATAYYFRQRVHTEQ